MDGVHTVIPFPDEQGDKRGARSGLARRQRGNDRGEPEPAWGEDRPGVWLQKSAACSNPLKREVVESLAEAGDLASQSIPLDSPELQLRDSAGLAPASPLCPGIRAAGHLYRPGSLRFSPLTY